MTVFTLVLLLAQVDLATELRLADELAWAKKFAEAEARYLAIVGREPRARLGLARVVLWQGRYAEASARFDELLRENANDVDALEGRASAAYWSGDLRRAVRDFRRVLALQPDRELARRSLAEIASLTVPSQRIAVAAARDDQPLEAARAEASVTFFSDPLTRWTVVGAANHFDGYRYGARDMPSLRIENETRFAKVTLGGSIGVFDGRLLGGASVSYRELTLRVEHGPELAAATALGTDASSTVTALRWSRERENLIASVEVLHRNYFDDNAGRAFVAYAVVPMRRNAWTLWTGASVTARDTDETRFHAIGVSSALDAGFFRYSFRGAYDPYWSPDDLREARVVVALERTFARGRVKIHGDGGFARDRGRAFGPDAGLTPLPAVIETYAFDRTYRPYRAGISADVALTAGLRLELGFERGATVDYRSNSFHAALVRRR